MKFAGLKKTLIRGLTFAIPLAIVGYVFIRIIQIIRKIIAPGVARLGIHRLLGSATLTVITILLIIIVILILGLLLNISFISNLRQKMEDAILRFVPSLNYLKLMEANQLNLENSQNNWKPVLLKEGDNYHAAFIVEESDDLVTLFVSKGTSLKEGEILTTLKKNITTIPATFDVLNKYSKAFGKGFISIAENASVK